MTDEEVINQALKAVNEYAKQQKSKVVVTIKISDTLACTQEIKYSDIKRGLLPGIIADVAEAVDLLIGKNLKVSVWKMSNDCKRWVTWSS